MVRWAELIQMRRDNVDLTNGIIQLEANETKTKRARFVPLFVVQALADNTVRKNIHFRHTGVLFYILNGGDQFTTSKNSWTFRHVYGRKNIQMTNSDIKKQHKKYSPISAIFK